MIVSDVSPSAVFPAVYIVVYVFAFQLQICLSYNCMYVFDTINFAYASHYENEELLGVAGKGASCNARVCRTSSRLFEAECTVFLSRGM